MMDIVRNGVILIAYLFVIIVIYIVISSPFDEMVTSLEDINMTNSDAEVESSGGNIRTVFDMCFVGLALVPIIWFISWAFSREPDWRFKQ